ncbi:nuclear transport factor 2 family protein [Streptomyces sp.]|uniref:nuclear transport factor 2 family protein n=1 Tax=Streptomyces sp. TaxID=1931 RepID=UPI002F3F0883
MTHEMTPAVTPDWILQIMREIDSLEFGAGFGHMTEDTEMFFGTEHVRGVEAIKAFFVKIDEPLNVTHEVLEFWTADEVRLLRGEAAMARKTEPQRVVRAPFIHIYYVDDTEPPRIRTLRVTAGPLETDAVL